MHGDVHGARAENREVKQTVEVERDQTWYRQPDSSNRTDTRAIIQQKAQVRAAQRTARIASMNWYGMSNSRPTAASTPFTSMYSPVWQHRAGGRLPGIRRSAADERDVRAIVRAMSSDRRISSGGSRKKSSRALVISERFDPGPLILAFSPFDWPAPPCRIDVSPWAIDIWPRQPRGT